jgi:RNA polymerase sigma factor (sigma-70 family)
VVTYTGYLEKYKLGLEYIYGSLSDECLVKVFLNGDENAFTQLYERYRWRIYFASLRIIHDPEESHDATQEIFIKFYRSLHRWNVNKSKLSTWIYQLAKNHSIDYCRKRFRRAESQLPENNVGRIFHQYANGCSVCSPFRAVKDKEDINLVRRCIDKLPELQKKTFINRHIHGLKLVEIAEMECRNLATVKASLYRATKVVRRNLLKSRDLSYRKVYKRRFESEVEGG